MLFLTIFTDCVISLELLELEMNFGNNYFPRVENLASLFFRGNMHMYGSQNAFYGILDGLMVHFDSSDQAKWMMVDLERTAMIKSLEEITIVIWRNKVVLR